jgi:hypothetical protein
MAAAHPAVGAAPLPEENLPTPVATGRGAPIHGLLKKEEKMKREKWWVVASSFCGGE